MTDFTDEPEPVRCLCSGEYLDAGKARRLGCDQPGGCPELRDSMEGLF
ncbi:hypothetical protein I5J50_gp71 [Mycobacterium phage Purky]|uniref:Uncharacterized protein n=1 Tax=Mycobacterium phage Purky TaxID=2593351 RepID=A0A514TWV9_9CAUD|nr:hypothetical protein I5J50_gp71 [Mycobacterium phage Purky]QDK01174.1 hypothetical protein SEA_PURKY_71 [Mycobacterium phage Purky]